MPKTPEGLCMPHAGLLPGTAVGPADPHSWAQPPPSIAVVLLKCMHMAFRFAVLLFPQRSLFLPVSGSFTTHSLPLCHLQRWCISHGRAASSLQNHPQILHVPLVPQAITEVSRTGHWVGQHMSHTAPSTDPAVPVWVVGTLQPK